MLGGADAATGWRKNYTVALETREPVCDVPAEIGRSALGLRKHGV